MPWGLTKVINLVVCVHNWDLEITTEKIMENSQLKKILLRFLFVEKKFIKKIYFFLDKQKKKNVSQKPFFFNCGFSHEYLNCKTFLSKNICFFFLKFLKASLSNRLSYLVVRNLSGPMYEINIMSTHCVYVLKVLH